MKNYRPIFLLTVFLKVLKKSMLNQQLHSDNLLVAEQHVFRQGISTEQADIRLTDSILNNLIKKEKSVERNFCDLAKILTV
jgi:hypothetical protein